MPFRLIADKETRELAAIKSYEMGPFRFVLIDGLLKFGFWMFVCVALHDYFIFGDHTTAHLKNVGIISAVAGTAFGSFMWPFVSRQAQAGYAKRGR
jgi:hypothetical protein